MEYVAGIFMDDRTRCWICDLNGRVLSRGESDGVRYKREGTAALGDALGDAFFAAAKALGVKRVRVLSVCIPDVDTASDELRVRGLLNALDIADDVLVYNDSVAAFIGAIAPEGEGAEGVMVIGDMGTVAFGMTEKGDAARAGGWEFFLSDEGSVYWIAKRALRSVMKSYDGRGDKTSLEMTLMDSFKLNDVREFVDLFYAGRLGQKELTEIFRDTIGEAKKGDEVSVKILERAEKELLLHAKAVIERLGLQEEEFEIATRGVVFDALRELGLYETFQREVRKVAGGARFIEPRYEPVCGALALALEKHTGKFIMPEAKR